ncbi:tolB protein [Acidisarcina polymorpha]|uniref:TolB protein n=1 Tax=Acidisarcina polymorpha TaxID=2211140 RepID=A0A2Z5G6E8_9BACT|nr:tolB protein [Acidisarcina polymorpha]
MLSAPSARSANASLGIFAEHGDVGKVLHPGSVEYNAAEKSYTVSGSGENMWFGHDDFHFVWTKVSGDVSLTADIAFVGATGNNHRKAVLMIRQSLDGDATAVDVARHGDGLTALQFRDAIGANTHEVESNISAPQTVRIVKRGDSIYAFVSKDGKLVFTGASTKLALTGPFYVGIGVCSHDKDVVEKAVFTNVKLVSLPPAATKPILYSTLETIAVASTDRHVVYGAPQHFEAPNWSRDGSFFLFNQDGKIYRLALDGADPSVIPTSPQDNCNNDHGISPDGQSIAVSDSSGNSKKSSVYIVPIGGGTPRQITENSPSYWHGWSPDGRTLAFTGERNGDFDIYTIPVSGGTETRLTTAKGLDDGPEYSPDGLYIYFNSVRTGSMQIWRMKADGSAQEQVLSDDTNDWFPHISPDGKWMVFLSYEKGVTGHPAQKDVMPQLMSMEDKKVHVLATLFGGQGTINVPSWSPDSKKLAFVSYSILQDDPAEMK